MKAGGLRPAGHGRSDKGDGPMALDRKVPLLHRTGLHLRAAGRFAETASRYQSDIRLRAMGREANGKSVLEILTLGAGPGAELTIQADGPDAEQALDALESLVRDNFGEEA